MPFGEDYGGYERLNTWLILGLVVINFCQAAVLGALLALRL